MMGVPTSSLDAVESVLREHPNVRAVATFTTVSREPALRVAAVVAEPINATADIRDQLGSALDPGALPDLLLGVPELPHDDDGAVDTGRIERELLDVPGSGYTFRLPVTPTELELAEVWSEVLGRPRVFAGDNFLDLGGDSMTAVLLLDLINERLGVDLPLDELLAAPSLSAIADVVDQTR
jgi:acyl carrier protein